VKNRENRKILKTEKLVPFFVSVSEFRCTLAGAKYEINKRRSL